MNDLALTKPKPFLKWVGGKRGVMLRLLENMPGEFKYYHEPFVGAGSLLFEIEPQIAVISDTNENLMLTYRAIQKMPDLLIRTLRECEKKNTKIFFEVMRSMDRYSDWPLQPLHIKAARMIYLNKTAYNGLYRVNKNGYFNAPWGKYIKPNICDEKNIMAVHQYLNRPKHFISIKSEDFRSSLKRCRPGSFVYLDPPYDPLTETANFVSYGHIGFSKQDHTELRDIVTHLTEIGVMVMLSNSDTPFTRELYANFRRVQIHARRNISQYTETRDGVPELLITNYLPGETKTQFFQGDVEENFADFLKQKVYIPTHQ